MLDMDMLDSCWIFMLLLFILNDHWDDKIGMVFQNTSRIIG